MLYRPDLVERLTKWSIELSEFEVFFKPRKSLKSHLFAYFLAKMTPTAPKSDHTWVVFTEKLSKSKRSGASVILENNFDLVMEVSVSFMLLTTNNQAKYEAFIIIITLVG